MCYIVIPSIALAFIVVIVIKEYQDNKLKKQVVKIEDKVKLLEKEFDRINDKYQIIEKDFERLK